MAIPALELNDGRRIPQLGLGVFQIPPQDTARAVTSALEIGYRHIDTAAIYQNEAGVGEAITGAGLPRGELFVTTKLWNAEQGYDSTLAAFDASLKRLKLDDVDLYLIHWPCPQKGQFLATWKALIRLRDEGRAKSIGVSNFRPQDLDLIIGETGVVPAVNQIELHPYLQQRQLRDYHAAKRIVTEAWSPLARGGEILDDPVIAELAAQYGKTPAQVVLRWHIDHGLVIFPKSMHRERLQENFALFDFRLEASDLARIDGLERGQRIGPDPSTLN
ncbi:aldo/keto reductase [Stutzerimonas stutzeri]|uniref:aldo/keto reductase n=1 Tax=Stutzerimonas stutzeri TaxID=316 RepID=UPI00210D8A84|nr:aldo/keto reductase [Stutzerimonas stutzeri]MCQ4319242.1 aldo/keto reductase [Stutzerimonas stutzeri]